MTCSFRAESLFVGGMEAGRQKPTSAEIPSIRLSRKSMVIWQWKEVIKQRLTVCIDGLEIEELLEPCAEFLTERESWIMDGRFGVHLDTTDFGHVVGEVDLTRVWRHAGNEDSKEEEEQKRKLSEEMDSEIKTFMLSHPKAFPAGLSVDKLSAYFHQS